MNTMLVSELIPHQCLLSLENKGISVVKLPPFHKLQIQVSSHADMLLFPLKNSILTHLDYYLNNKSLFDSLGVNIVTTNEPISPDYPNDVLFNAVLTDNGTLFAKKNATSKLIVNASSSAVSVKQGYTACSTCCVSHNAFITTDIGLFNAYSNNGIDCLLVSKNGISLQGYNCGFIGGASAVDTNNVYFFGDLSSHIDGQKMADFIFKHGKTPVSLAPHPLIDIGGARFLSRKLGTYFLLKKKVGKENL